MMSLARFALLFVIFFPILPVHAAETNLITIRTIHNKNYISLHQTIARFSLDHSFDIILQRGKLYHQHHVAVYQVGFSAILIDGMLEKSEYPVLRVQGEVMLPVRLFEIIIRQFFPDQRLVRNHNAFSIAMKRTPFDGYDANRPESGGYLFKKREQKDRIGFIIIDAGHGGKDPGAIGRDKTKEKHITLAVSKLLEQYLKSKLKGIPIKLIRRNDRFVELGNRTEWANRMLKRKVNGIFLSIHVNASISRKVSGFETYFLSQNPTNEGARTTATMENTVVVLEDKSFRKKYNDVDYAEALMMTTQIQKESSLLAHAIQAALKQRELRFKSRGVKKADFYVLRGVLMPAALVEIGYISHPRELRFLKQSRYQRQIAAGIGNGVMAFIKKYDALIKNK